MIATAVRTVARRHAERFLTLDRARLVGALNAELDGLGVAVPVAERRAIVRRVLERAGCWR